MVSFVYPGPRDKQLYLLRMNKASLILKWKVELFLWITKHAKEPQKSTRTSNTLLGRWYVLLALVCDTCEDV